MTDETMNLHTLVEKAPDADLLREMIAFARRLARDCILIAETFGGHGKH